MCDHCHPTRREILKLAAASLAATLAACQANPANDHAVSDLPDAFLYDDHLKGEQGQKLAPVKIDPKTIVVPPPPPAERTDFGDIMPRRAWTRIPLELPSGDSIDGIKKITIHHSGDGKPFL